MPLELALGWASALRRGRVSVARATEVQAMRSASNIIAAEVNWDE